MLAFWKGEMSRFYSKIEKALMVAGQKLVKLSSWTGNIA